MDIVPGFSLIYLISLFSIAGAVFNIPISSFKTNLLSKLRYSFLVDLPINYVYLGLFYKLIEYSGNYLIFLDYFDVYSFSQLNLSFFLMTIGPTSTSFLPFLDLMGYSIDTSLCSWIINYIFSSFLFYGSYIYNIFPPKPIYKILKKQLIVLFVIFCVIFIKFTLEIDSLSWLSPYKKGSLFLINYYFFIPFWTEVIGKSFIYVFFSSVVLLIRFCLSPILLALIYYFSNDLSLSISSSFFGCMKSDSLGLVFAIEFNSDLMKIPFLCGQLFQAIYFIVFSRNC